MYTACSTAQCSGLYLFRRFQPLMPILRVREGKLPLIKVHERQALPLPRLKACASTGRDGIQNVYLDNGFDHEPFWLSLIKDIGSSKFINCRSLRVLFQFLAEQPSQLKHIEWPSFQSTLKTATLTLVIVAFLIVALCSVDSTLCYILALLSRKPA
ncbi:Preprotein translocase subunit SECE1 [Rhynchospora pubera]|uniref:Preprotein translocase subunit SECE1 n=1 Tax=Rhynchospora pubera TaxID=906938 RepID=A0AAV8CXM6_9POAL|nr:Preprotein translocase subunit SECE1 [Rhynchospora pubera]